MNRTPALLSLAAAVALIAGCAATTIPDSAFGLRKASVFEVIPPTPFGFAAEPTIRPIAPTPGSGMPPMISHAVDEYLPLTLKSNECLECHDKPASIGKPVAAGKPRPAPAAHYGSDGKTLRGDMYNCMACHAPQTDVPALVTNLSR